MLLLMHWGFFYAAYMTNIPPTVASWCQEHGYGSIVNQTHVSGGCINDTTCLSCSSGQQLFLKQNHAVPREMFVGEAAGLKALRIQGGPRIPEVRLLGDHFLLMEFLQPGIATTDYWQRFGRELAHLHLQTQDYFGFSCPTYCGATRQENEIHNNGYTFFSEQRLLHLGTLTSQAGYLSSNDLEDLAALCNKLPELIPDQKPSPIHGDLWSGNAHIGPLGEPCLIDPAVYYGWPEADLAMTTMFGRFPDEFYAAYNEVHPLDAHYQSRFDIYNLYHYLNHVHLFGSGYVSPARNIIKRFC